MIESKLIPRFRSLWCHQRPGKLTTALGLRPRAVVSFPGRWWHHNDLNLGINSYNSTLPGQNGRHFTDNIFRCISMNEKSCILIKISMKFVPWGLIDNKPALIKTMAWCWIGDKLLSEPMLTQFTDPYMQHLGGWGGGGVGWGGGGGGGGGVGGGGTLWKLFHTVRHILT